MLLQPSLKGWYDPASDATGAVLSAYKERVNPIEDARPCCGVYVQQVNRIARLRRQIQTWSQDNRPSSVRDLCLALKRKERMENWLAVHTHDTSLACAAGAPIPIQHPPGD